MFWQRLWQRWLHRPATCFRTRPAPRRRARLMVEPLEDRAVPATFTAATVADLIAGITAANQSPEADTITLAPGKTFTLTQPINPPFVSYPLGFTGLPIIAASGGPLTILGNGDVIERSTDTGWPAFRLFTVDSGASLTLENLTLQGGRAYGTDRPEDNQGGAILSLGTLTLRGVTVQNNVAQGQDTSFFKDYYAARGGGIYSAGTLTLEGCTIRDNQALGRPGAFNRTPGREVFLDGGDAYGGGIFAYGTVTLRDTTITGNVAKGGANAGGGTRAGQGIGGGLYLVGDGAYLDAFTVDHVKKNKASSGDQNIHGSYTLLS
jgi:large repetitive protein